MLIRKAMTLNSRNWLKVSSARRGVGRTAKGNKPLLDFNILQLHTPTGAQTLPGTLNALQEHRVMFEPIFKPFIL
jgi:hypothetical protein